MVLRYLCVALEKDPHRNPLPEYRAREREGRRGAASTIENYAGTAFPVMAGGLTEMQFPPECFAQIQRRVGSIQQG